MLRIRLGQLSDSYVIGKVVIYKYLNINSSNYRKASLSNQKRDTLWLKESHISAT